MFYVNVCLIQSSLQSVEMSLMPTMGFRSGHNCSWNLSLPSFKTRTNLYFCQKLRMELQKLWNIWDPWNHSPPFKLMVFIFHWFGDPDVFSPSPCPMFSSLSFYLHVVFPLMSVIELDFVNAIELNWALLDSLQQYGPDKNFLCDSVSR